MAWNRGAHHLNGWSEDQALNIRERLPEERPKEVPGTFLQHAQADALRPHRMQRLTKEGETVDLWVTMRALTSQSLNSNAIMTPERSVKESTYDSK